MVGGMTWWDALVLMGVAGLWVGIGGVQLALLRLLPWGKNWHVGGCF